MKKLAFMILVLVCNYAHGLSVSIAQSGTGANSCTRTLTASVSGGSGNYTYTRSIVTPAMPWPGPNNVSVVNLTLNQTVDVNLSLHDNVLNQTTVTVYRILTGSFSVFIPNLITPNGDGFNDNWIVTNAAKNFSPINAYGYTLTIKNSGNTQVYAASGLVVTSHLGIIGGDIQWNGRVNGTGSIVLVGTYSYQLTLVNCSQSTLYTGSIRVWY